MSRKRRPDPDHQLVVRPSSDFRQNDGYKYADLAELLCLFSKDSSITRSEILARLGKEDDIDQDVEPFDDDEDFDQDLGDLSAEFDDIRELDINDWFSVIKSRQAQFSNAYPFVLEKDGETLRVKKRFTDIQYTYILMLFASNQGIVGNPGNTFTSSFERICVDALQKYLPPSAEIHNFGAGLASMRVSQKYSKGNLYKRITELANDLGFEVIVPPKTKAQLKKNKTGDGGLDVVAWLPMQDKRPGTITIFGQCACTNDWVNKQHTSSVTHWISRIRIVGNLLNFVFIPICFRDATGDWHNDDLLRGSILFDRLRLINLLHPRYSTIQSLTAYSEINKLLSLYEEDVA